MPGVHVLVVHATYMYVPCSMYDSYVVQVQQVPVIYDTTNSGTIETRTELAPKSLEIARNISIEIFVNSLLYYIKLGTSV